MATSSITKNFVIEGQEQVDKFIRAYEESERNRPVRTPVAARELRGIEDLKFLNELREKANGSC